jgi:hypothetical protein
MDLLINAFGESRIEELENRRTTNTRGSYVFPKDISCVLYGGIKRGFFREIIGIRQGYFRQDGWFALSIQGSFLRNTSDSRRTHFTDRTYYSIAEVVLHRHARHNMVFAVRVSK